MNVNRFWNALLTQNEVFNRNVKKYNLCNFHKRKLKVLILLSKLTLKLFLPIFHIFILKLEKERMTITDSEMMVEFRSAMFSQTRCL